MAKVSSPAASAALEELVHQFADPYAFVRELVQNAIDANSAEIEIDVAFSANGDDGVITISVDDSGDGMNREIIEKQLTRLFSSSKDGDRTKIGKFGIGFVSVFSLEPDAVCVDTARDGRAWRVLFGRDRRYELIALDEPIEGTKVRIVKRGNAAAFAEHRSRCETALRHWCHHVQADVRFGGRSIREPFAMPTALVTVESKRAGTHIVLGHMRGGATHRAYYNAGLTLHVDHGPRIDDPLSGLAFKVSSERLEHTLTRDAVIHDRGFEAVTAEITALVDGPLAEAVFSRIAEGVAGPLDGDLAAAAAWHLRRGEDPARPRRVLAQTPSGKPITIAQLRGRDRDDVLRAAARAPVTDALEREGRIVYLAAEGDPRIGLVHAIAEGGRVCEHWCLPPVIDDHALWPALAGPLAEALATAGTKIDRVVPARFDYPDSPIGDRLAITQARPGALTALDALEELSPGLFARRQALLVNLAHPTVDACMRLAQREPVVAGYLCAKAFGLGRGLDVDLDTRAIERVVALRWPT